MQNENHTAGIDEVSRDIVEAVLNLAYSGSSPEAISFVLRLNTQIVQMIIADDPIHRAREVQSIKDRSAKYRCSKSSRLMASPVMDRDENFYEHSIIEANPSLSREQFMPSKKLKAKIEKFSTESMLMLERHLRQRNPQEDILELTAECLSVLSPDAWMETALRVLEQWKGRQ
jgi:hypothetical protein